MGFLRAVRRDDLREGDTRGVCVRGRPVLLVCLAGQVLAYEDRCAHLGLPVSEGCLEGTTLTCAAHAWQYDLLTGRGTNPASVALRSLPVRVEAGDVLVDVDAIRRRP